MAQFEAGFLPALMVKIHLIQFLSENRDVTSGTCLSHYCHQPMQTKQKEMSKKLLLVFFLDYMDICH
jgi:hypothetical protein